MIFRLCLLAILLAGPLYGQDPPERTRLYTKPDPAATGGIKGHIAKPETPIEQILALSTENIEEVYAGDIIGPKRDAFQFTGLPVGKYDLVVIFDNAFYEGLQLTRDASTLTAEDLKNIEASIMKSEPFFTKKIIHRTGGVTGLDGEALCVCTYAREKGSNLLMEHFEGKSERADFRRTYKLVLLKNVGPGWQIVRARDLYPVWMDPKHPLPGHHFSPALNPVRVADEIKDLGNLDLTH